MRPMRFNLLTLMGAVIGAISIFLTWVHGREEAMLGPRSPRDPVPTGPFRDPMNLLETTFIQYSTIEFWLAALFFVVGTVLLFYTSWGVISQIVGYLAFLHAYATASWISSIPAYGMGPKLGLVSAIFCFTSLVFPYWIGKRAEKGSVLNRFLAVDPGGSTKLLLPSLFAVFAGLTFFLSLVASYSEYRLSVSDKSADTASILFAAAGFILMALAYLRLFWDATPMSAEAAAKAAEVEFPLLQYLKTRWKVLLAVVVAFIVVLAGLAFVYKGDTCEISITVRNSDPSLSCQYGLLVNGVMKVNATLAPGESATSTFSVPTGWYTVQADYVWLNDSVVKGLGTSVDFERIVQLMPFRSASMEYSIPAQSSD
ncbi:MAG: hypothetical protein QXQ13_01595 [Thermoplasmata archaeon]